MREFLSLRGTTCLGNLFPISCNTKQGFPNKTRFGMKCSPLPGLSQKNYLKPTGSQSHDSFHSWNYLIVWDASITGLFDQVLQALLCNFSPFFAKPILFSLAP